MQAKEQAPVVVAHNVGVRFILQNKTKVIKKNILLQAYTRYILVFIKTTEVFLNIT